MDPKEQQEINQQSQTTKKPNELGSVVVSGFVKIFDPNTQEVIVETRE